MADIKLKEAALQSVLATAATLANGVRAAADVDNGTNLFPICDLYLTLQYGTAPAAGTKVAEVYCLRGDGETSEVFPQGGDGTVGANVTPQQHALAGVFESRSPSTTVDEVLVVYDVPLGAGKNRFVILNTSGQTWDAGWTLKAKPRLLQVG